MHVPELMRIQGCAPICLLFFLIPQGTLGPVPGRAGPRGPPSSGRGSVGAAAAPPGSAPAAAAPGSNPDGVALAARGTDSGSLCDNRPLWNASLAGY